MIHKERSVGERRGKTNSLNIGGKALKPSPRGLFKTVERFLKKTDMIRRRGILKTKRLLTIYCFLKRTMEKGIFNI